MSTKTSLVQSSAEFTALLHDMVAEGFSGNLHALIFKSLYDRNPCTLKDLWDAVIQQDGSVTQGKQRAALLSLVKHKVVRIIPQLVGEHYAAVPAVAMFPLVMPLLLHLIGKVHGAIAEIILCELYREHILQHDRLMKVVLRQGPALGLDAIAQSLEKLVKDGIVVATAASALIGGASNRFDVPMTDDASTKRPRDDKDMNQNNHQYYSISVMHTCALLRLHVCVQFLLCHFVEETAAKIVKAMGTADLTNIHGSATSRSADEGWGSPCLPLPLNSCSSKLPLSRILSMCRGESTAAVSSAIDALAEEDILLDHSTGTGNEQSFVLNYAALTRSIQHEHCRAVILARYGIVGNRVYQLLREHQSMEEQSLVDEALQTPQDIRVTLAAMHRDGFVRVAEIPRVNSVEKERKMSFFLWSLDRENLYKTVTHITVKSLRIARTRLTEEETQFRARMPAAYFTANADTSVTAANAGGLLKISEAEHAFCQEFDHRRIALSRTIAELTEKIFVLCFLG